MPEQIEQLEVVLDKIHSIFKDDFFYMDFFFCYKNKRIRTIFNHIRSLPNLLLRSDYDAPHPAVTFQSTWTNVNIDRPLVRQVDPADSSPLRRGERPKNYYAHSTMGIPLVSQINVFEWGFEILSEAGIDMVAIKSTLLRDATITFIQSLVGQTMWSIPSLRDGTDQTIHHYWRKSGSDDFDNFILKKQHGTLPSPTPVDQRKALVLDDEE